MRHPARTDANGKTTQYGYDALGRLTGVTDALNQITNYTYDEVSNRIAQTDANNHTTNYAYDQRGRRTKRTLPLGQAETYTYDPAGNLLTKTDFSGKITTYSYDPANRLLSKTPDASFNAPAVTYGYTNGRRASMTDVTGTTVYSYDTNGRPTQVWGAEGQIVYTYDAAGNLTRMTGPNSIPVNYTYDALNRLHTVQEANTGTTTYGYDNVGNLQSVTYPSGVVHVYTYDNRNRLTNLGVNNSTTAIASYAYTLDAAGHRTGVTELSRRAVSYGYDDLYRLTAETISGDPNAINGAVSYVYDPVGNRTQKTSTLPGFPGGLLNYDANDRLTTDTYDSDGNTTASAGTGYVYDFENHVIQAGAGITMVYDGDGNRVSKTVAGVTTKYLVDTQNPTGYAQVIYETFSGGSGARELNHTYVYGLDRISQYRSYFTGTQSLTQTSYYVYDGHGSVRALTDPSGNVTDTYDYDAFGNLIHSTGTTFNEFLFAGEQFDSDLGLYYNRARYLNVSTGRFWTMDSYEGNSEDPLSMHKYLYAEVDPVDSIDPTGRSLSNFVYGGIVHDKVGADFLTGGVDRFYDNTINTILGTSVPGGSLRPDLADRATQQVYEIKPVNSASLGYPQLAGYLIVLNRFDPLKRTWIPGLTYFPPPVVKLDSLTIALVSPPVGGVIIYEVLNVVEIYALAAIAIKSMVPQLETEFGAATLETVY